MENTDQATMRGPRMRPFPGPAGVDRSMQTIPIDHAHATARALLVTFGFVSLAAFFLLAGWYLYHSRQANWQDAAACADIQRQGVDVETAGACEMQIAKWRAEALAGRPR